MSGVDRFLRLLAARDKSVRTVLGLISGTSMDGVDVACVRIHGSGPGLEVEGLADETVPYPPSLRKRLVSAHESSAGELARLDMEVGAFFAEAALCHLEATDCPLASIDLVGSHGQTICHEPPSLVRDESARDRSTCGSSPGNPPGGGPLMGGTLQLGDGDVIAHRLGVPTVSDFRRRDMAAGGEGAPLVPYLDHLLFGGSGGPRVLLNLGGIANVTYLGDDSAETLGFDTGPANMILDALAVRATGGQQCFDQDGRLSRRGQVREELLAWLLEMPFFSLSPPRSAGREQFGGMVIEKILERGARYSMEDVMATVTQLTVQSVANALVGPQARIPRTPSEVLVSGGGVHNPVLMESLRHALAPVPVESTETRGVSADAKEAVLFAVLASETVSGRTGNLPSVTGASAAVPLGKISL